MWHDKSSLLPLDAPRDIHVEDQRTAFFRGCIGTLWALEQCDFFDDENKATQISQLGWNVSGCRRVTKMSSKQCFVKARPLRLSERIHVLCSRLRRVLQKRGTPSHPGGHVLPCTIAYNKFGGYCVPLSARNRPAAQRVLLGEVHEPETIEFIIRNCGEGDIIHAGTFFWDFLPVLSLRCGKNAMVWAFEPNPESYKCARITLMLNDLTNVRLFNAAIGARADTGRMLVFDDEGYALGGASRLADSGALAGHTVAVQISTIDRIFPVERTVSVLHLDVEGHEAEALLGALETITRHRPVLILETLPDQAFLSNNLETLGYRVIEQVQRNWVLKVV